MGPVYQEQAVQIYFWQEDSWWIDSEVGGDFGMAPKCRPGGQSCSGGSRESRHVKPGLVGHLQLVNNRVINPPNPA